MVLLHLKSFKNTPFTLQLLVKVGGGSIPPSLTIYHCPYGETVNTRDLKSLAHIGHVGSNPTRGTINKGYNHEQRERTDVSMLEC